MAKNKPQHTPEPWTFDETWALIKGPNGEEIAAVHAAESPEDVRRAKRQPRYVVDANARVMTASPKMAALLRRILGMHESGNCGAFNGEAVLSESVADEIRALLKEARVEPYVFTRKGAR